MVVFPLLSVTGSLIVSVSGASRPKMACTSNDPVPPSSSVMVTWMRGGELKLVASNSNRSGAGSPSFVTGTPLIDHAYVKVSMTPGSVTWATKVVAPRVESSVGAINALGATLRTTSESEALSTPPSGSNTPSTYRPSSTDTTMLAGLKLPPNMCVAVNA